MIGDQQALLRALSCASGTDIDASRDVRNSISSAVVRCRFDGRSAVAVAADTKTTIGAVLDLLSLHLTGAPPTVANSVHPDEVVLMVANGTSQEALDAIGTLTDNIVAGPSVRVVRVDPDGQTSPLPMRAMDFTDPVEGRYEGWLHLLQRVGSPPESLVRLVEAVGRDDVRAYPSLSRKDGWSLRVEGLEVGRTRGRDVVLEVGKNGSGGGLSTARRMWLAVAAGSPTVVTGEGELAKAAELVRAFAGRWISDDHAGAAKQDEHALESRVLRGAAPISLSTGRTLELLRNPGTLSGADAIVNWGSQFPTRWGRTASSAARYLDALLRDGDVPWALELKAELGSGVGRYYRHAVGQAILYRHFIRTSPHLKPWFDQHGLDQTKCQAGVVLPHLNKPRGQDWAARQQAICDAFGIDLIWVAPELATLKPLS